MKKNIITISREFGSGGRTIGKQTAELLGIPYYDKEIIEKIAEETGFDKKYIEEQGEHSPSSSAFAYSFIGRNISGTSNNDYIWAAQRRIITKLAEEGPCVIVGRCADFLLKDREDCLHVFIYADTKSKAERIVNLYGETSQSPEKRLKEKDKMRSINYKYYAEREWGRVHNYHVALDSGAIGIEGCAEIIAKLAKG